MRTCRQTGRQRLEFRAERSPPMMRPHVAVAGKLPTTLRQRCWRWPNSSPSRSRRRMHRCPAAPRNVAQPPFAPSPAIVALAALCRAGRQRGEWQRCTASLRPPSTSVQMRAARSSRVASHRRAPRAHWRASPRFRARLAPLRSRSPLRARWHRFRRAPR